MLRLVQRVRQRLKYRWLVGCLVGAAAIVGFLIVSSRTHVQDQFTYESQRIGTIRAKLDGPVFAMMQSGDINVLGVTADEISLTGMAGEILGLPAASSVSYEANRYSPERDAFGLRLAESNEAPVWLFPGVPPAELPEGVLRLAQVAPSDEVRLSLHSEASGSTSAGPFVMFSLQVPELVGVRLDVPDGSEFGMRTSGRSSAYSVVESGAASDMRFDMSTEGDFLALSSSSPDSIQVNGVDISPDAELREVIIITTAGAGSPNSEVHSVSGLTRAREQMAMFIVSDTDARSLVAAPASQQAASRESAAPAFGVAGVARDVWISRQPGNLVVEDRSYAVSGPSTMEIRGIETRGIPATPSGVASPRDLGAAPEDVLPLEWMLAPPLFPANANFVLPLAATSQVNVTGRSNRVLLNGRNVASTCLDNYAAWVQPLLVALAVGLIVAPFAVALAAERRRLPDSVDEE